MTKPELREKIAEVIDNTFPWTREDCLEFADKIIKVIPGQEMMGCKYAVISYGIGLSGKVEEINLHCKMNPKNDYKEIFANKIPKVKDCQCEMKDSDGKGNCINCGGKINFKPQSTERIEELNRFRFSPPDNFEQVHYAITNMADKIDEIIQILNERGK